MGKFKIVSLAASVLLLCVCTNTAYVVKDFQAAIETIQCRGHWGLEVESIKKSIQECPFVSVQGRKNYQEDRVICNLNMWFSLLEKYGKNAAKVDLFAVFDGHGGAKASETVKQQLVDKFLNYVVMDAFHKASDSDNQDDLYLTNEGFRSCSQYIKDAESLRKILGFSLSEAIRHIDSEFSLKSLYLKRCNAGSTASVVLMLNYEELLVANVGNSRVILCADSAEELTTYHNHSNAARVKGKLAVSRVIGDAKSVKVWKSVDLKMVGWRNITAKDRYLVVASTGIFESLTPENVCQLVEVANYQETIRCSCDLNCSSLESSSLALAQYVVRAASEMGSTDNLSAVVVPLAQAACVHKCKMASCNAPQ